MFRSVRTALPGHSSRPAALGDGRKNNGDGLSYRVRSCCVAVRFGGIADHARTCRWLNSVANDSIGHCWESWFEPLYGTLHAAITIVFLQP